MAKKRRPRSDSRKAAFTHMTARNRVAAASLVLVSVVAAAPQAACAASGDLDPSFGSGGKLVTSIGRSSQANGVAVQPDGKIVAVVQARAAGRESFGLTRYDVDGSLDTTFGATGEICAFCRRDGGAFAIAIQPDSRIVAAGYVQERGRGVFAIARFNTDGTPDASFGSGGKVTVRIGSDAAARALSIAPDGKIVAAGVAHVGPGEASLNLVFAVTQFNTGGTLDASFGNHGMVTAPRRWYAVAMGTQVDGKIVGLAVARDGTNVFGLVRFNTDGTLDRSFGSGGKVETRISPGGPAFATSLVIQPDGKIVAAGNGGNGVALVRYNADGTLDRSFGTSGIVTGLPAEGFANAVALQADGKIVIAGGESYDRGFLVARYETDGTLDSSFGIGGKVVTLIGRGAMAAAVVIQSDGKLVVAGACFKHGSWLVALARYL